MSKKLLYNPLEPYAVKAARTVLRGEGISNNPDLPDVGQGGNLIDFGIEYFRCSVSDFLEKINVGKAVIHKSPRRILSSEPARNESKLKILSVKPLFSLALFQYLSKRAISADLAEKHCQQVYFELSGKPYFAIGFKNDSGGYELRNAFLKISSTPKDITTIDNSSSRVCVFEGFFDFLSYKAMHAQSQLPDQSYMVLNSIALFNKALPKLRTYDQVQLFLDCDRPGQQLTRQAMASDPRFEDASGFYKDYKDINEWLISKQNPQQKKPSIQKRPTRFDEL
ncbi:toprim domain-containing protein [Dyadobacter psychrophilus]|uniref:Toprim-like n=1 Tax=Dyadobacter psychrophilus TaxID=651661 RepID=A0A1T5HDU5_9BACT|nr:toprim domain-containing protein [Dyadobacter psychrophilus]SKC18691.1 Toprim-like [Dyadobacter psychrophilus]